MTGEKAPDCLTVKQVAERANRLIEDRGGNQLGAKRVGGIIRSLGLKTTRKRDGYRFSPSAQRIKELVEKYAPETDSEDR